MSHKTQILGFAFAVIAFSAASASAQLTIEVKDYLTMPKTGLLNEKAANDVFFARVNAVVEEPGGATRPVRSRSEWASIHPGQSDAEADDVSGFQRSATPAQACSTGSASNRDTASG
jgi:hypothetical protein